MLIISYGWRQYDYLQEFYSLRPRLARHNISKWSWDVISESAKTSWGELNGCVSKKRKLFTMGLLPYVTLSTINELTPTKPLTDGKRVQIEKFISRESVLSGHDFSANEEKNVIVIIVESLNSWALHYKVKGKEVMPNLNRLIREDGSIVADNLMSQAAAGRSSDGQLIINTGLLPLRGEASVLRHSNNEYPSLAKAFGSRTSFEVICEERSLWKHGITSKSFGYDNIYDITDAEKHGIMRVAREDMMFRLAEDVIKKTKQPFFCTLITLAMHGPHNYSPKWQTGIYGTVQTEDLGNYLEAAHFFDAELGRFINRLKKLEIYNNSLIVITADHELAVPGYDGADKGTIPFIALNTGINETNHRAAGQIDVYPTILEITGAQNYWWKGIGRSLLAQPAFDGALNPEGNVHGTMDDGQKSEYSEMWQASENIIRHDYFRKQKKE